MNRFLLLFLSSLAILACNDSGHYESAPSSAQDLAGFDVTAGGDYTVNGLEEEISFNEHDQFAGDFLAIKTGDSNGSNTTPDQAVVPRKLIRSGSIQCKVASIDTARKQLIDLLERNNGYVASENASLNYRSEESYTLRIPEDKFDEFLEDIDGMAEEVVARSINVKDVTDQYVDIAARLSTKRALHARYTQLLSKAKNVKEVIEVERELAKVLGDIESSEARLKSLSDQASYATLSLTLFTEIEPIAQASFFSELGESFSNGWTGVKMAVLLGATLWPLLIFGLLLIFSIRWMVKRRSTRNATA